MKVVYSTRKFNDVATKPTDFELKPFEPEKNDFLILKKFQVSVETRMNSTALATTMKVAYSKQKFSDVATKSTIFERIPTEPKKKDFMNFLKIFKVPYPEIRMTNTST